MHMDYARYILTREQKIKTAKNAQDKLDIAEAINYSYIASQPTQKGKSNQGLRNYRNWRHALMKIINPGHKRATIWGRFNKSKKLN